jgi:DNA gyrase/topoisomerase IV subunit B
VPKLEDANLAGGASAASCTLIVTEGDSAKALAVSGLSIVGRDRYGVFPLRGKLLNVRDASAAQLAGNDTILSLKAILGLEDGKTYHDTSSLRYGKLMIMTDQDHDGSHIKGLIINFLHAQFPSLLRVPGFVQVFITPIVKASRLGQPTQSFYTLPQYDAWAAGQPGGRPTGWNIKYYKGLVRERTGDVTLRRSADARMRAVARAPPRRRRRRSTSARWTRTPRPSCGAARATATASSWRFRRAASRSAKPGCAPSRRAPSWTRRCRRCRTATSFTASSFCSA